MYVCMCIMYTSYTHVEVLDYYLSGRVAWSWFYEAHYAPLGASLLPILEEPWEAAQYNTV